MLVAVLTVLGTVAVALLAFFGSRLPSLESQRQDFQAIVQPLRDEVKRLQDRVQALEDGREKDRVRFAVAVQYIRDLLAFIRLHVPSFDPPAIPEELSDDV